MSQEFFDPELFADFIAEAKEHLETIEPNLLELEKAPDNLALLNDIFRPMHSLKGASGFLGLNRINQLAHKSENILDELRKGTMVVTSEIMDVILASTDALRQMIDLYNDLDATILGCQEVPLEKVSSYGIVQGTPVEGKDILKVNRVVEKPAIKEAPSRTAVLGRYIVTPDIFEILAHTQPGKGGEIQLTDALQTMASREAVYAYCFEGKRYDVGDKLGFLKANVEYALRRPDLAAPFRQFLKEVVRGS